MWPLFLRVWRAVTGRDQTPQAAVDVRAPRVRTDIEAFLGRDQSEMREPDLGLSICLHDVEMDFGVLPFALVAREVELIVAHAPHHFHPGNEFCDLDRAAMDVPMPIAELAADLVGDALDIFGPPSAHVVDGVKRVFRRLVDRESCREALVCHDDISSLARSQARPVSLAGTKAANSRSNALTTPARQPSAIGAEAGSGKISSSPRASPSKMDAAADAGDAFGISRPRFISVSTGPRTTPWTVTLSCARRARSDSVMLSAGAFELE